MEGTKRFGFFLLVLFFAGSIALIATHELRDRVMSQGEGSPELARKMIRELRGDVVKNKNGAVTSGDSSAGRRPGHYLHDNDRQKLNEFIKQVVPVPQE